MSDRIDLHMHTVHSDGCWTVPRLLEAVRKANLAAFSITDHDTVRGYLEAVPLLTEAHPELIPGLELSVNMGKSDLHMLAYLFDVENEPLRQALEQMQEDRNQRGRRMVEKLNGLGVGLSLEAVLAAAGGSAIGRPHLAEAMIKQGLVANFEEAFRKHIGDKCEAYVSKSKMGPAEAIRLVHEAGGVTVAAHPFVNDMHRHLEQLIGLGLDGVEVYHYAHSKQMSRELKRLAKRHGVLMTGGSDFHGRQRHESEIGAQQVSVELLDRLKARAEEIRGNS